MKSQIFAVHLASQTISPSSVYDYVEDKWFSRRPLDACQWRDEVWRKNVWSGASDMIGHTKNTFNTNLPGALIYPKTQRFAWGTATFGDIDADSGVYETITHKFKGRLTPSLVGGWVIEIASAEDIMAMFEEYHEKYGILNGGFRFYQSEASPYPIISVQDE